MSRVELQGHEEATICEYCMHKWVIYMQYSSKATWYMHTGQKIVHNVLQMGLIPITFLTRDSNDWHHITEVPHMYTHIIQLSFLGTCTCECMQKWDEENVCNLLKLPLRCTIWNAVVYNYPIYVSVYHFLTIMINN